MKKSSLYLSMTIAGKCAALCIFLATGSSSYEVRRQPQANTRTLSQGNTCEADISGLNTVQFTGYVMDTYCVELGVLLDNSQYATLESPEMHSIHCLVDPAVCANSIIQLLGLSDGGDTTYEVKYKLDEYGTDMVNEMAWAIRDITGEGTVPQMSITGYDDGSGNLLCVSEVCDQGEVGCMTDTSGMVREPYDVRRQPGRKPNALADDNICDSDIEGLAIVEFNGYVMDTYCIDLGVLLDNPDVATLQGPEKHSIHCLVDPSVCADSIVQLLGLSDGGDTTYEVKYSLDEYGTDMVNEMVWAIRDAQGNGEVPQMKVTGYDDGSGNLLCASSVCYDEVGCMTNSGMVLNNASDDGSDEDLDTSVVITIAFLIVFIAFIGWSFLIDKVNGFIAKK